MPASLQELTERLEALQKELERYGIVVPQEGQEPSEGGLTIPSFDAIRQALELSGDAPLRLSVQNDGTQLNRQRTLNFTPPLVATESSVNKRIDVTASVVGYLLLTGHRSTGGGWDQASTQFVYDSSIHGDSHSFRSFKVEDGSGQARIRLWDVTAASALATHTGTGNHTSTVTLVDGNTYRVEVQTGTGGQTVQCWGELYTT